MLITPFAFQEQDHQLTALYEQLKGRDEQIKKMAAQAASQQASANYIIHQLQTQLDRTQSDMKAANPIKAIEMGTQQPDAWSIQDATARVAQVLQSMTTS